jgi:hypothetical protein
MPTLHAYYGYLAKEPIRALGDAVFGDDGDEFNISVHPALHPGGTWCF